MQLPEENLLTRAKNIAEIAHTGQVRIISKVHWLGEAEPYIEHCKRTAMFIESNFPLYASNEVLAAAILHDSVEDSIEPLKIYERIYNECGPLVAGYVDILSKPKDEYFRNKRYLARLALAPPDLLCIKLADRIDNLQSMPTDNWDRERILHYIQDSKAILEIASKEVFSSYVQTFANVIRKEEEKVNGHERNL